MPKSLSEPCPKPQNQHLKFLSPKPDHILRPKNRYLRDSNYIITRPRENNSACQRIGSSQKTDIISSKKDGDITKATMDASLSSSEVVDNISKMSIEKGESSRARNKKRR